MWRKDKSSCLPPDVMSPCYVSRLCTAVDRAVMSQYRFSSIISKTEVPRDVRNSKGPQTRQAQERIVSTLEQMQVPNGTGPGVRRSKRPLLASRTRCNVLWKPKKFGNKVKIGIKYKCSFSFWYNKKLIAQLVGRHEFMSPSDNMNFLD